MTEILSIQNHDARLNPLVASGLRDTLVQVAKLALHCAVPSKYFLQPNVAGRSLSSLLG
jgi:hypothetical protein